MSNGTSGPQLILASGSRFRRGMLSAAGVTFEVQLPEKDETAEKSRLLRQYPKMRPQEIAEALAVMKAEDVSSRWPDAWVIAADQVLALGARVFSKPVDVADARAHLQAFAGQTHHLFSAVVIARGGKTAWRHLEPAAMTMRDLNDVEIDRYLALAGADVSHTVGAYAIEGLGGQLFERVEGDYFSIIGLPLLPLLAALRGFGLKLL
jgi:septum formation protein